MKNFNKQANVNKLLRTDNDDDDDGDFVGSKTTLGYFMKQKVATQYTVTIDEAFTEPSYYRGVVSMLMGASEEDTVIFLINSPGGRLSGLLTLLEGVNMTDATTLAILVGECSSAASMFALHCDQVFVSENATMLCHNVSYGTNGKGSDVLAHVNHVAKTSEKLLRSTYLNFLSEKEVLELLNGQEIYLDSDEIKARLEQKQKATADQEQETEPETEPETEVKVKRTKLKTQPKET